MIELIFTIIFIYLLYYIWIIFNFDKSGKERKRKKCKLTKKMPAEFEVFVVKYKVDLEKVNYRYFLELMALVIAFDLGITITLISYIKIFWISIVAGFFLILFLVFISYYFLGKYFKKKGLVKND
ncbi:MAG: hypothetical protein PUD59_03680 [bacterium]|nr:hypothetical protein [bacterium]